MRISFYASVYLYSIDKWSSDTHQNLTNNSQVIDIVLNAGSFLVIHSRRKTLQITDINNAINILELQNINHFENITREHINNAAHKITDTMLIKDDVINYINTFK